MPSGYLEDSSDCNDNNPSRYPGAVETCNDADDDCDGVADEPDAADAVRYYYDGDKDTYGRAATFVDSCTAPSNYVVDDTDCDDTNAAVNPAAKEICNGLDDDCDTLTDDSDSSLDTSTRSTWYVDSDSDGTAAGSSPPDEETEAQFLARYAAEARRLAGAGDVDPDSGDVEDADDGSELELDGVMMGPPGSEARALLNWLQSRATAADLGALAATLQAHPVDGLEQVSNLQTVLSSIPQAAGGGAGGGNGSGGPSASSGSAGVSMDFGGLAL